MHKLKYKIQFIAVIAMLFICANSSFAANLDSIIKNQILTTMLLLQFLSKTQKQVMLYMNIMNTK